MLIFLLILRLIWPMQPPIGAQTFASDGVSITIAIADDVRIHPDTAMDVVVTSGISVPISRLQFALQAPGGQALDSHCTQLHDPDSFNDGWIVCTYTDLQPGTITTPLRGPPVGYVDLRTACTEAWFLTLPFSIAVNGRQVASQARITAPYIPGWCVQLPLVT